METIARMSTHPHSRRVTEVIRYRWDSYRQERVADVLPASEGPWRGVVPGKDLIVSLVHSFHTEPVSQHLTVAICDDCSWRSDAYYLEETAVKAGEQHQVNGLLLP